MKRSLSKTEAKVILDLEWRGQKAVTLAELCKALGASLVEEAPEGGYTARALGHAIFTEGETPEQVESNARDAVLCHFDEGSRTMIS